MPASCEGSLQQVRLALQYLKAQGKLACDCKCLDRL